jgi:hypothetical protein
VSALNNEPTEICGGGAERLKRSYDSLKITIAYSFRGANLKCKCAQQIIEANKTIGVG